jgi:serine protease Do
MSKTIAVLLLWCASAQPQMRSGKTDAALSALSESFESLAERAGQAVVQIHTTQYTAVPGIAGAVRDERGSGSGVILDPGGLIVTNAHVVKGARAVQVLLSVPVEEQSRWRSILKPKGKLVDAQVIGLDPETDLAVLKIDGKGLPWLELADSDRLRQGQLVLALGSPLGLDNSVSLGVISSVARQFRPEDPMIYIQTDAPINPGNSGGPLVDTNGRVVGINTLIFSQSGGSEGLGFAAPSNIVRTVFEQIRKTGRVQRGQIGVNAQTITPVLAAGLHLRRTWGVILSDVFPGGPAQAAGLKVGDLVLSMNDKPMENARQFEVNLYQHAVGESVRLEVQRGIDTFAANVAVIERTDDPFRFASQAKREARPLARLGILALDLQGAVADILPALRQPAGVLVAARLADASNDNELQAGDLIGTLNGNPVRDLQGLQSSLESMKPGEAVVLQVQRLGLLTYISLELP